MIGGNREGSFAERCRLTPYLQGRRWVGGSDSERKPGEFCTRSLVEAQLTIPPRLRKATDSEPLAPSPVVGLRWSFSNGISAKSVAEESWVSPVER